MSDFIEEMEAMTKQDAVVSSLVEKDLKVIVKAMEKMVTDIKKLKEDNVQLHAEITGLKALLGGINHDLASVTFDTGADMDVRQYMLDTAPEDATDTPLSVRDIATGVQSYQDRHRQYGYGHH